MKIEPMTAQYHPFACEGTPPMAPETVPFLFVGALCLIAFGLLALDWLQGRKR